RIEPGRRIGRKRRRAGFCGRCHDADRRSRRVVELLVFPDDAYFGLAAAPAQLRAQAEIVGLVVTLAAHAVTQPAVAVIVDDSQAERGIVADGYVEHTIQITQAVVADAHPRALFQHISRLVRHDRDRAARAIAAKQRALRAFQHFDALHVVEQQQGPSGLAGVDAICVDADRRIGADAEVADADAAQRIARLRGLFAADDEAGDIAVHLRQVGRRQRLDLLLGDDLDRDRHILHFLRAALRGD